MGLMNAAGGPALAAWWHLDASGWSATAAWVTVLVYVILGLYARWQLQEARVLREDQARPFVIVDVEPSWILHLVVQNVGKTVARDVTLKFTPELESTHNPWHAAKAPLLTDGAAMLPPGREYRFFLDSSVARLNSNLPQRYDVEVTYSGPHPERRWGRRKPYVDHYLIDLGLMRHASVPPKGIPDLVREVEKLRGTADRWTDGIRGLRVTSYPSEMDVPWLGRRPHANMEISRIRRARPRRR